MKHYRSSYILTFSLIASSTAPCFAQEDATAVDSQAPSTKQTESDLATDDATADDDTTADDSTADDATADDATADDTGEPEPAPEASTAAETDQPTAPEAAPPTTAETATPTTTETAAPAAAPNAVPLAESESSSASAEIPRIEDYETPRVPTPFDQGRIRLGLGIGWASSSDTNWTILGLGAGYFVFNGLAAELDSTFWIGGEPFISTLTPGLRYVFHMVPTVKPYIGAFYRHYFVGSGRDDSNGIGGRAGVYFMVSRSAYIGGGIVYERLLDDNLFYDANQVGPEITFSLAF